MADEKKEPWLNYLAVATVIFAVCATLSSFRGSSYSTRSIINQTQAANQWAYFQSKSIKGYLYELQKENLELDRKTAENKATDDQKAAYHTRLAEYAAKIAKYDEEKAKIQQDAKDLEAARDHAQAHSKVFGIAVIYLQIAILLSSIAALLKKKPVWFAGLVLGVVGVGYFVYAFFIFVE